MHRRVLRLAYAVLRMGVICDILWLRLSGRAMHISADRANEALPSFDLRQLQWYRSPIRSKKTSLRRSVLEFALIMMAISCEHPNIDRRHTR
jgi:hypothetical protein